MLERGGQHPEDRDSHIKKADQVIETLNGGVISSRFPEPVKTFIGGAVVKYGFIENDKDSIQISHDLNLELPNAFGAAQTTTPEDFLRQKRRTYAYGHSPESARKFATRDLNAYNVRGIVQKHLDANPYGMPPLDRSEAVSIAGYYIHPSKEELDEDKKPKPVEDINITGGFL